MHFPYLIWDFDGTLFDTYPPLIRAIERALADFDAAESYDVIADMLRGTLADTLNTLSSVHDLDRALLESRMTYYHGQASVRDNRPFHGAIRVLERVLVAGGQNFIVTHRDSDSLSMLLNWYRVTGLFEDMITSDDGFARKPSPEAFNAMIARHSLARNRVLAIGDRDLDILAGQAAGVHTCLYNAQPSEHAMPEFFVRTFSELEAVLDVTGQPV